MLSYLLLKMDLSVVILNFSRPDYLKNTIIPSLKNNVDEIIISHGKKEAIFEEEGITSLNHSGEMNQKYGLSLRFLSALEAKNNYIIIMDDDIIIPKDTIDFLLTQIKKDDKRLHGIYGRDIQGGYTILNNFGEVPIVLTRCLITTKEMCQYYMDNFRNFESETVKNSRPYWNGEDILFSLLSIEKYNNLPMTHDLSHTNRISNYFNFSNSISLDGSHLDYRKRITKEFVEKLKLTNTIKNKKKIKFTKGDISYFIQNSYLIYFIYFIVLIFSLYIISRNLFNNLKLFR